MSGIFFIPSYNHSVITLRGNHYLVPLLFIVFAFICCHHQKEMVNDKTKVESATDHKVLPGALAIGPGTFGAEAEVISVAKMQDSIGHVDFYKAPNS